MNIRFYSHEANNVWNLGGMYPSLKAAYDDSMKSLRSHGEPYIDKLGFLHCVSEEEGDRVVGIYFVHYRNLIRKLSKWINAHKEASAYTHPDHDSYYVANRTLNHLCTLHPYAKMCTSVTDMAWFGFDNNYSEWVNCWTNDPIKQAHLVAARGNRHDFHDTHIMYTVDRFGFMHTIETHQFDQTDTILGFYYDYNDHTVIMNKLRDLQNSIWHGKPVVLDEITKNAVNAAYEGLANEIAEIYGEE